MFNRPALIAYSDYVSHASKRLHYPTVVYRGAVPAYCHRTGRWLAALWVEKYGPGLDGCRLRVRSMSSYERGTCIRFWRDRAANVCLASVNSACILHIIFINQLSSGQTWRSLGASLKNRCQTLVLSLTWLARTDIICVAELATWGVDPDVKIKL